MSPVMAELLLSHGANKNLRNRAGNTPYQHLLKEMKRQGIDESNPDAAKLILLLQ
jgi:ankyrin repeat protein